MEVLNFPEYRFDFKKQEEKLLIFDIIRKKHVVLTPEEWVRQHLIHYLIYDKSFPKSLMKVESGLRYNRRQKRADLIVYNAEGNPHLVAECKAPSSPIDQKVLFQIGVYQKSISPGYLIVTNGLIHLAWKKDVEVHDYQLLDEIPHWKTIS